MKSMEMNRGSNKHVIEKIKRISVAMDKGEFWIMIFLAGFLALAVTSLAYFLFF